MTASASSGDPIVVTGAAGFVGSAVVREGVRRGYRVRAMVRQPGAVPNLAGVDAEVVRADMRDPDAVDRAVAGARYVFHVAADYRIWAPDPDEIVRNNVAGARTVLEAARRAGAERVVYTSSVATLKPPEGDGPATDETTPHTEASAIGAYKRSKVAAERAVEALIAEHGTPAVIVNPSTPIGPRDIKPTPTGRVVVEAAAGRMPAYVDTGLNLVHVDDVAVGHFAALDRGRVGERYVLGGEDVALGTMLADIAALVHRKPPTVRLPRRALFPLAYAAEAWARVAGREPFLTVDGLRMARYRMYFSSAKAERELGYRARPYREALRDAVAWFDAAGYLK